MELSIGVSVRATNAEIITEPAITIPNSLKSLPVIPERKITGRKTEASATVVDIIAKNISADPLFAASAGYILPSILV